MKVDDNMIFFIISQIYIYLYKKYRYMEKTIWKKEEDDFLFENYESLNKKDLISHLQRTWIGIQSRASKLGIKRIKVNHKNGEQKIWKTQEIKYLKENYKKGNVDDFVKKLGRSWSAIQQKAFCFKLKRESESFSNPFKLINGSNESLYWIGFCLADGHFNEKSKQLQINLAIKDFKHLKKLAKFINYT